ncbi:MAG: glycolate oxidase subunit GlcF [Nevskiaceae bacterium]|nr:glycolate oxidase subunit GlcF [Nevskiaceae bacterium]
MQTQLSEEFRGTREGEDGAALLRSCVHCGFCTATCPTYQLLGDERDGPRGRIHLVKQLLEGQAASASTRLHLDRCLTCRACESTCPSGVQYGRLLDIGRAVIERKAPRSSLHRVARRLFAAFLTGPLFAPAVRMGRLAGPLLPLRWRIDGRDVGLSHAATASASLNSPKATPTRRMLLLDGCVQPALAPQIDAAARRLFARCGIELVNVTNDAGCCGSVHHHLTLPDGALTRVRANIDAWWPLVESGIEAILTTASGCGTMLRDYAHLLRDDPAYAQRAARISALARDPSEILAAEAAQLATQLPADAPPTRVAFHSPCSLQHGLRIKGVVENLLRQLGAQLTPVADAHLCCGSAGTYSLLQPALSEKLGHAKVQALQAGQPQVLLTANVGCLRQIAQRSQLPVLHWIEWVERRLRR